MADKTFLTAEDVAEDLSITQEEAKGLIRDMGKLLEQKGHFVIKGRVPHAFYEKQKEVGFLWEEDTQKGYVRLDEKRLLTIEEFCCYANVGMAMARKLAKYTGAEKRIGRKVLVDRITFDRWCDSNTSTELN